MSTTSVVGPNGVPFCRSSLCLVLVLVIEAVSHFISSLLPILRLRSSPPRKTDSWMPVRVPRISMEESDPIAAAIAPPRNESPAERQRRVVMERTAKQVSDAIDEQISRERQQGRRQPKPVKILLLGLPFPGKSTTLKNFQLMYEPKAFRAERASWRAIIQLNVIRSIRIILEALSRAASGYYDGSATPRSSVSSQEAVRLDAELLALRMRLLSLLQIEDVLARRLDLPDFGHRSEEEVTVNSTVAWKGAFFPKQAGRESFDTQQATDWDDPTDPGEAMHARSADMKRLWAHPTVQTILERQGIRLQESPGFFLDSLDEVTTPRYVPTDDHILRARLKTLGVSEHRMRLTDPNRGISREFAIFDVGGQRSMRAKWVPYFDDMEAIIFLAPISAFDQMLEEDPTVNRLGDSFALWTSIVSNKLLSKANLILFMNKVDIMQAKLASGIRLSDYLAAYGRRPNDFDSASRYLRKQFNAILKQSSPEPRIFYCHLTSVVDTKSTTYVLVGIKDMLMRFNLRESHLII
ncbi:guanine nucleotide binding protein, alpha subunit [Mycena sp. CBHHK59/15]|nr:guanine nucleotide binding protein, alpha subunit [Mycena sp. CBHHK59/15]